VPSRFNSPSDVEIDAATRDASLGTLRFAVRLLNANSSVLTSVVNGINKKPNSTTHGEGPATGEEVEIGITFTNPILLPAGHYFFRPEVLVTGGGDFLFLSAPKPIVTLGPRLLAICKRGSATRIWLRIGCASAPTSLTTQLRRYVQYDVFPDR